MHCIQLHRVITQRVMPNTSRKTRTGNTSRATRQVQRVTLNALYDDDSNNGIKGNSEDTKRLPCVTGVESGNEDYVCTQLAHSVGSFTSFCNIKRLGV